MACEQSRRPFMKMGADNGCCFSAVKGHQKHRVGRALSIHLSRSLSYGLLNPVQFLYSYPTSRAE